MNPATVETSRSSPGRWLLCVGLVLAAQIGLIFILSDHSSPPIQKFAPAPTLRLATGASGELLALSDPTLFALPHWRGFSGPAWLNRAPVPGRSFEWKEEPRWLPIAAADIGGVSVKITTEKEFEAFQIPLSSAMEPVLPSLSPPMFRQQSEFRLEGNLASQKLLTRIELRSWTNVNTLTNTVVSLAVNAEGSHVSSTILSKSGYEPADQFALAQAKAARFQPVDAEKNYGQGPGVWRWGTMTFIWHTVPASPTNNPAETLRR